MAVTPVRTGPLPTSSFPSPEISVACPTSTPRTSVIALLGPGAPSKGTPRSRARGLVWAETAAARMLRVTTRADQRMRIGMESPANEAVYKDGLEIEVRRLVHPGRRGVQSQNGKIL